MSGEHNSPVYAAHSPTRSTFAYSPRNGTHQHSLSAAAPRPPSSGTTTTVNHSQPNSPSTRAFPAINGSGGYSRDRPTSGYYDPTSDQGDRATSYNGARYPGQSPIEKRDPQPLPPLNHDRAASVHHSPILQQYPKPSPTPHAHPAPSMSPQAAPAMSPNGYNNHNRGPGQVVEQRPISQGVSVEDTNVPWHYASLIKTKTPNRSSGPMALSSILTTSQADPTPTPSRAAPSPKEDRRRSKSSSIHHPHVKTEAVHSPITDQKPVINGTASYTNSSDTAPIHDRVDASRAPLPHTKSSSNHLAPEKKASTKITSHREVEAEYAKIEAMDESDVEGPGFDEHKVAFLRQGKKRALDVEALENTRRKRRREAQTLRYLEIFNHHAAVARDRYVKENETYAWAEVHDQEKSDEKERKKDMQRKRRREKTIQSENQKREEALARAAQTVDEAEREKYLREAAKATKKATATGHLLHGTVPSKEIREVTPLAPNLDGGMMSTFSAADSGEAMRKRGRTGPRLKKSKEQKQMEKDNAVAAHAAMERDSGDLVMIAPKEDPRRDSLRREFSYTKESTPSDFTPFVSKGYNQLYEQIWRDLARKDVPKVVRIKNESYATKQSNLRKTAQLASKEARRWQLRTNKSMKDVQARAKRTMREMLSFWKRNERDERDQRKNAERQELENAKKAEAEREANRAKRKLNFLISQTELYSHFIGKKVKTDEVERSTDDVDVSNQTLKDNKHATHTVDLPDSVGKIGTKVTDFDQLDFDAEDESVLREAAMANAQNAVQEAQDRARAFNNDDENKMSAFDDGEMNFQNPTSLQNMDIAQPKMLAAQLKEYQLKGLNWLVNLYEQGINGILADEMGLGKTVQSISVMAHLAEQHNIWGPFLVIAPASTLHNWQQEITRFIPDLKVLPYWGNAKDRKVLRKFWDRRHITYRKESPFHVLVTSYQLVVMDTPYFQKMRWQYMILDEAQAIKSSQSSRWKALLGFHCRNRLLLTGTPIQNNMQELWALLHFIMPSLFDSHDEFSDWFSKDIESHAQSNTKLNEDQLKRLHMILKPFMLRRVKKHVQKELGDKIEEDVFCDLTYRQRAYYTNLRNKISIMDLIEKAAVGDDQDTATLMNLVMQFRKVCNHPDLFERADVTSPVSFSYWAETASYMREGNNIPVRYSVRNLVEFRVPRLVGQGSGRLDLPSSENEWAGWRKKYLNHMMNIWTPENIERNSMGTEAFSWLRLSDTSAQEASLAASTGIVDRVINLRKADRNLGKFQVAYGHDDDENDYTPKHAMLNIIGRNERKPLTDVTNEGRLSHLMNISRSTYDDSGLKTFEPCARPAASAPPVELVCSSQNANREKEDFFFNPIVRRTLYPIDTSIESRILETKADPSLLPPSNMLPAPVCEKRGYTQINVPSMRRFVTDCGKLAKLDALLRQLKEGGHRVLLYFQMTRMIDLMEEYLTYRNYKYCRLDGSTKLEDRRDTVADFQTRPEIFVFLLSTRAGGLGINLTSADTVIFYDSDWNPTIDSQAMDRAHRLGQTRQVTVYRMITRGTIEERIRKRALQKEEVQRVVISGGAQTADGKPAGGVDFNTRSRENRTKDIALWLADDEQAEAIERKEKEVAEAEARGEKVATKKSRKGVGQGVGGGRKKEFSMDDMYHEGEGHFDDVSAKPSGTATPVEGPAAAATGPVKGKRGKGTSKKAKTVKQRLAVADGEVG
ncbi:MAG: putative DNA helicase ino80 [Bogoriella megaspora]|nr:MAG: putative DNA helicase ino80 [Bogoriella megaspora]